jgi:hypothetical protein
MTSKILHRAFLLVATVLAFGLGAWGQCSNATVTGKYGFAGNGLDKNGKPTSFLGYFKADGKGKFAGVETGSDDGTVFTNVPLSGTYSVSADCTGSVTAKLKGQKTIYHTSLVVLSGGKSLQTVSLDAPTVQAGTAQAQGKATCTLAGLKGNFGVETSGVFIGVGAVAFDGLFKLDGKGNVSGTESGSVAGTIFKGQSVSGTYTVASNCTGTLAVMVLGQTEHASFVATNGGKGMLIVETDASTVVSGFGQQ